jgi:hypothetical protein
MSIRNFTLNFNGDQMLAVNEGNTPYLSSCDVSYDGSISTNCSLYSINPYGKYAGVSFSYNNKNIFTVSASSDSSIAYTQYDPTTNTVADNFADGIVNQMPYNSVLQSAYFGPTYVIMSSWENGMFFCTMDIATSKINECNPWADVASFTNIDGIAVFQ